MKSFTAIALGCIALLTVSAVFLGFSGTASFAQQAFVNLEQFVANELPIPTSLKLFLMGAVGLLFLVRNRNRNRNAS